ncbi:MAG: protein kinase [Acidobacteriia bacterium]|nr:protein kinase [Terriglobia bacterium]
MGVPSPARFYRFGAFQLDLRARELRRNGVKVRVPDQSIQVLAMLLEHPGEVVTRDELHQKLWPNGTIVEFDHSINAAIKRLRQALEDSVDEPVYVETLPRLGYRFIGTLAPASPEDAAVSSGEPEAQIVSHYRILEKIGGGGMGVVYKAEDTRLGRIVALKFLPEEFADDKASLDRFQREARAVSALNHPNICTLYDVGQADGRPFLAMEFLEGQTLLELIEAGPVTIDNILDLGMQIADALDAAHAKGIVHRDIKPSNIFVTSRGHAKVMDFGVAKMAGLPRNAVSEALLTNPGSAVGTAAYMSPEQARGEPLDARTDLFSFGVVLYEMATSQRPFQGDTTAVIFDAILNKTPLSPGQLRPDLPAGLELTIHKALEKDRDVRYQTASELRADLKRLRRDTESGKSAAVPTTRRRPLLLAGVLTGLLAVIAIVLIVAWFASRPPAAPPELRERQLTANPADNPVRSALISPDGKYLAYSDLGGIHLKLIATGETRTIAQTEGWDVTSWFPDGSKLLANGADPTMPGVWAISLLGGTRRKLHASGGSALVSPDGSQIAFGERASFLGHRLGFLETWVMGAGGEEPRRILGVSNDQSVFLWSWSADSKRILYVRGFITGRASAALEGFDLLNNKISRLRSDSHLLVGPVHYSDAGTEIPGERLIYSSHEPAPNDQDSNLRTLSLNSKTGEPAGTPQKLTHWSTTAIRAVSASADGKRLVVLKANSQTDVYISELEANGTRMKTPHRLTLDERHDLSGPWMPDGKTVAFTSNRNGTWDIFKQAIDQPSAEPVVTGPDIKLAEAVTPDGAWLIYSSRKQGDPSAPAKLMRVPMAGGPAEPVPGVGVVGAFTCATRPPSTVCVLDKLDQDGVRFSKYDLVTQEAREIARVENVEDWDLFHDGSRIAVLINEQAKSRIRIISLSGETEREFALEGSMVAVYCAADGRGLYLSSRRPGFPALLYSDLRGQTRVIWQPKGDFGLVRASPDGRYLSVTAVTGTSDAWLLEDF